jgi:hypothetical protein
LEPSGPRDVIGGFANATLTRGLLRKVRGKLFRRLRRARMVRRCVGRVGLPDRTLGHA